ncbi:MAG: glycosyltransferase family 4 protein [Anaerolineales bacterium]|nr:glycosyltransferase family 4 protein [Anaerolineales bacterium]
MSVGLPEKVGLEQRVLPMYRAAFFDSLARSLPGTLSVFAGSPAPGEGIPQAAKLNAARWTRAENRRLGLGRLSLLWQHGWREWVESADPDLLILEANPRYLSNVHLAGWMKARGRPVVGWTLGPARAGKTFSRVFLSYYRAFSALVVYSGSGAADFQNFGISPEKIFVAPNAVESETAEALQARPNPRESARESLALDPSPVILFVGRLQRRKRVEYLLRACARLGAACQVVIVGDGPDRARLERIAAEVFPAARFTGDLRGEALGRCFLAADLFVMPGTGGLALQEAMVFGKPVAAAEADGSQKDLIREGENGWLLPPGDEAELSRILREALADPRRLEQMGEASRRIVRATATMEKMVEGFLMAIRYATRQVEKKS